MARLCADEVNDRSDRAGSLPWHALEVKVDATRACIKEVHKDA